MVIRLFGACAVMLLIRTLSPNKYKCVIEENYEIGLPHIENDRMILNADLRF